jgi:hypothetical protein
MLPPLTRFIFITSACLAAAAFPAVAQPANETIFQDLAAACLSAAPDTARAFRLSSPERMPYLRARLVDGWQREGRAIYVVDTVSASRPLPRLSYEIEEAGVTYDRAGRGSFRRTVTLAVRHTLEGPDGRLLQDRGCRDAFSDLVRSRDLDRIENSAFHETMGQRPEAGWMRRIVEPVVLTAATAIGVYLFFTLRSQATESR